MSYYYYPGQQQGYYPPPQETQVPAPPMAPVAGATVGQNGLYQAPADLDDDLEVHPASQFVKLNVMESGKYAEMWFEATSASTDYITSSSKHETMITGKGAVAFLGRAADVTRPQLRLIWSIADHTERGALHQGEFNVALRLIALAQRGAELSENGLRNFAGIQLVPQIKEVEPTPPPQVQPSPTAKISETSSASIWTITPQDAERYEQFFMEMDSVGTGYIDGLQGVAFFSRSGLPKPVLKTVWGLADLTRNGKLDREEFRNAFRLISALKRGQITVDQLPPALDPAGPFWVRVGQEGAAAVPPPSSGAPPVDDNALLGNFAPPPMVPQASQQPAGAIDDSSLLGDFAPPPVRPSAVAPNASHNEASPSLGDDDVLGFGLPVPEASPVASQGAGGPTQLSAWQEDPNALREQLRSAAVAQQQSKRQVEEMQEVMEKLRMEKAEVHNKTAVNDLEVKQMREAYQDMMVAKAEAEQRAAKLEQERQAEREEAEHLAAQDTSTKLDRARSQNEPSLLHKSSDSLDTARALRSPVMAPSPVAPAANQEAPPKMARRDSLASSSDDDDGEDFWGTGGSLKPPPMGAVGTTSVNQKDGSGPNDEDDWTF